MTNSVGKQSANEAANAQKRDPKSGSPGLFLASLPDASDGNEARRYGRFSHAQEEADRGQTGKRRARRGGEQYSTPQDDVSSKDFSDGELLQNRDTWMLGDQVT